MKDFKQVPATSFKRFIWENALNADLDAAVNGDHEELIQNSC